MAENHMDIVSQWGIGKSGKGAEFYDHLAKGNKIKFAIAVMECLCYCYFFHLFYSCDRKRPQGQGCVHTQVQEELIPFSNRFKKSGSKEC